MDITCNLVVATGPLLSYQSLLIERGLFTSFPNWLSGSAVSGYNLLIDSALLIVLSLFYKSATCAIFFSGGGASVDPNMAKSGRFHSNKFRLLINFMQQSSC